MNYISITDECYEFYALSELRGYLQDNKRLDGYRFCVERLYQTHVKRLAEQIFDYLAVVSFGECLHSRNRCKTFGIDVEDEIDDTRITIYKYPNTREKVYDTIAKRFDRYSMLKGIEQVFIEGMWRDGFGGESWGKIARLAARYLNGAISPALFIDYSINLHHNGGNVFNKPYLFNDNERMILFLNYRREAKSVFDCTKWRRTLQPISYDLYNLLLSWHFYDVHPELHIPEIREYPVLSGWGNVELIVEEKEYEEKEYDEDSDEEEESEDEPEEEEAGPVAVKFLWDAPYVPPGTPHQGVAYFIKSHLVDHPDEFAGSAINEAYSDKSCIEYGESLLSFDFKKDGYRICCTCSGCRGKTVWLLFKYQNDFHEFLKSGGHPKDWKEPETYAEKVQKILQDKSSAIYNPKAIPGKKDFLKPSVKLKGVMYGN